MNINLTPAELQELISRYESELRKLEFQVSKTYETIAELRITHKQNIAKPIVTAPTAPEAPKPVVKRKRGRPRKVVAAVETPTPKIATKTKTSKAKTAPAAPKRKRGRPKKIVATPSAVLSKKATSKAKAAVKPAKRKRRKTGGYKLSDWDSFVLGTLEKTQQILIKSEFVEIATLEGTLTSGMSSEDIYEKITRSIHKLANKRKAIVKAPFPGRGFAYALPGWLSSNGKLLKQYSK